MVGWHHQLHGHEFEQTPGDSKGQESLVCCSPWGHRVGCCLATEKSATYKVFKNWAKVYVTLTEMINIKRM